MTFEEFRCSQRQGRRQRMLGGTILASALCAVLGAPAAAQDRPAQQPAQAGEAPEAQDDTILVTARRREESLQETPIAISAFSAKTLEDRQWIEVVGHRETPGRPALYATTKIFLDDLGLRSLAELPPLAELDTSHLLEMPDAPTKAAEAAFALATPLLGSDETTEPGAARDPGEPAAGENQTVH